MPFLQWLRCTACNQLARLDSVVWGAACHVCLFVSETTYERGNRFLDRCFVVPIDDGLPPHFKDQP